MQIKTSLFIALAIGCASAENASSTLNSGMLMVNPYSSNCLTMLGSWADPFNALNVAPCTGNITQLWTFNPSDKTLCLPANGYCMRQASNEEPQIVHPTVHAQLAYNPSTLAVSSDSDCTTVLNIDNNAFDGSEPVIMYTAGHGCDSADDNEQWEFKDPSVYLAERH